MADSSHNEHDELIKTLTRGFESLLQQVQVLTLQNMRLEERLADAQKRFTSFAQHIPTTLPDYPTADLDNLVRTLGPGEDSRSEVQLPLSPTQALHAIQSLKGTDPRSHSAIQEGLKHLEGFKARRDSGDESRTDRSSSAASTNGRIRNVSTGSMRNRKQSNPMEKDFTSPGVVGNLHCPFASIAAARVRDKRRLGSQASDSQRHGRLPTPPETKNSATIDPIAAKFHAAIAPSPPPSVTASASKCPIRFLDQHSPEEVAQYFENHKHEIPRSHEVCVKRYQSNSESIRQLDAKYGNLVNMIKGLGAKHQPLLPTKDEEDAAATERKSMEKVEKWAEGIEASHLGEAVDDVVAEQEGQQREGHFDRPLKEIRVGESPSRPWGISVPIAEGLAFSNYSEKDGEGLEAPPAVSVLSDGVAAEGAPKGKCPFGHGIGGNSAPLFGHPEVEDGESPVKLETSAPASLRDARTKSSYRKTERGRSSPSKQPQMVFTGPVFIGYPAEQAGALMQQFVAGGRASKA